jgi:hypothetical protein
MAQAQVKALLGEPDETSSRTYGSATPQPWTGLEWTYSWKQSYHDKSLHIVFSDAGNNEWVVNDWDWRDY